MIRQRNQFDTHRTQATAATPTCCCCCCCLVALESSTAIVAQTAYLKGKETNNSLKWLFVALGILMWPIVAFTTTISVFAADAVIPTRYVDDGYGYYEESSAIPGWIGLGTAIVTLIAVLYVVYKFSGLRNPEISVLISIPAFVAFFALEFGLSLFALFGGVAAFEEFDSVPIIIGFYFLLTTSMSVGLTYLARVVFINNQKKRALRAGAPQYQPPQYPPGQPPAPPQAPPQY